jgi:hypothetical protein
VSRAFHELVAALLEADYELSDCIEQEPGALLIFADVEDIRRLVLLLGDERPSSRFGARLMVGKDGDLPVCVGFNRSEIRLVRDHVLGFIAKRDAWIASVERGGRAASERTSDVPGEPGGAT